MKILITGGAGFIGSHLVDALVQEGASHVVIYDNFSRGRIENLSLVRDRVKIVDADITDGASLRKVMHGVDTVYHLAAMSNVLGAAKDPDSTFRSNVVGTYEVLSAALSAGVRRLIFTSSREVYGDPDSLPVSEEAPIRPKNAYGVSKVAGELYCRHFATLGLETIVLRLANVYGSRDFDRVIPLFIGRALKGESLTVFGKNKVLDFLWIGDLIDVLRQAGQCAYQPTAINIGSGKGTNIIDLATRISRHCDNNIAVNVVADRDLEVGQFVADISVAREVFSLRSPADPINEVEALLAQSRVPSQTQEH